MSPVPLIYKPDFLRKSVLIALVTFFLIACGNPAGSTTTFTDTPSVDPGTGIHFSNDFTKDYARLGLDSGTNVVVQMNESWGKANGSTLSDFYPITALGQDITDTVPPIKGAIVKSTGPLVRFYINGNNLQLYAVSGGGGTARIKYDIAVIRQSDSKGWFTAGTSDISIPNKVGLASTDIVATVSLASLTGNQITTKAQLNGSGTSTNPEYYVYAIIRTVTGFTGSDLNEPYGGHDADNVIQIYPIPTGAGG